MEEHEAHEKKIDLNSELGMTRRDLLRRGAIVGGTLLWVAPAIQTMAPKAMARVQGPSPGTCAVCYCWHGTADRTTVDQDEYIANGVGTGAPPAPDGKFSNDDCENFCKWNGAYAGGGISNGPFTYHLYCSGVTACRVCTEESFTGGFCAAEFTKPGAICS